MKNKKVEQIMNDLMNVYWNIEKKINNSNEVQETKEQLLFLLRLIRPIITDVTYETHEIITELKKLDFEISYERDVDIDRKILYPSPQRWTWSYSDRAAAKTILNLNFDVLKNILQKLNKYINSVMLNVKNENIRTINKDLLFAKADKYINIDYKDLVKHYKQNYVEDFNDKQIIEARKQLFNKKTSNEDKEFLLKTFGVDLLILASYSKHKHLFNDKK